MENFTFNIDGITEDELDNILNKDNQNSNMYEDFNENLVGGGGTTTPYQIKT